jgi:hypothetical protein
MKKSIVFIVVAIHIFTITTLSAQKDAIGVRVGYATALQNHNAIPDLLFGHIVESTKFSQTATPQVAVTFSTALSKNVDLTLMASHQKVTLEYTGFGETIKSPYRTIEQYNFMAKADWKWLENDYRTIYSGAGIGYTNVNIKENGLFGTALERDRIIGHITLVGVSTKRKTSAYAELGLGAMGIISAGLKRSF